MAEKCICCGKKIGLLNGSHLNNQICDSCYFPIDGYLATIKESTTIQEIENSYKQLIQKIEQSSYSQEGKDYLIKTGNLLANDNKNIIQTKSKKEQTRKDFKITTGYNFEEYKISKYYSIASGNTVLGTGIFSELNAAGSDFFGTESDVFSDKLKQARNSSINKMIDEAINQGGNAVIGVAFNYISFGSNMIGVVANGTVVEIVSVDDTNTQI